MPLFAVPGLRIDYFWLFRRHWVLLFQLDQLRRLPNANRTANGLCLWPSQSRVVPHSSVQLFHFYVFTPFWCFQQFHLNLLFVRRAISRMASVFGPPLTHLLRTLYLIAIWYIFFSLGPDGTMGPNLGYRLVGHVGMEIKIISTPTIESLARACQFSAWVAPSRIDGKLLASYESSQKESSLGCLLCAHAWGRLECVLIIWRSTGEGFQLNRQTQAQWQMAARELNYWWLFRDRPVSMEPEGERESLLIEIERKRWRERGLGFTENQQICQLDTLFKARLG